MDRVVFGRIGVEPFAASGWGGAQMNPSWDVMQRALALNCWAL